MTKRSLYVVAPLTGLVIFFSTCVQGPAGGAADGGRGSARGEGFAGTRTCIGCHRTIHDSVMHSAHFLTSRPASQDVIAGRFTPPGNLYDYGHGRMVRMEKRDNGLYQVALANGREQTSRRMDIVIGSGRKAETFLYWQGDSVGQLPVSWFVTEDGWANSPHYPTDTIWFGRMATVDCFWCHSSYIRTKRSIEVSASYQVDQFDRPTLQYGVDCERCHGPAAAHVRYQQEHPDEKAAKFIASWKTLTREQRLDACAVCHSGIHSPLRSAFGFHPGDKLSNYYFSEKSDAPPDVHGNQYAALVKSKCFLHSTTLECSSCHDVHVKERDKLSVFSSRCMNCHQPATVHGSTTMQTLSANCIDCHMPSQDSKLITMLMEPGKKPVADKIRNHLIAVYPKPSSGNSGPPIR